MAAAEDIKQELLQRQNDINSIKDISILEIDELCTYINIKKDQKGEVIDFEVCDRSRSTYLKLAFRIEKEHKVKHLYTDDYSAYKYYKISDQHHTTKSETSLVESTNPLIRHYLASFNRRTKRYGKSIHMIIASLTLFFHKDLLNLDFYL